MNMCVKKNPNHLSDNTEALHESMKSRAAEGKSAKKIKLFIKSNYPKKEKRQDNNKNIYIFFL